ncbi:MAG: hypothetical protein J6N52_13405 [Clostridia bacterium]|nr:hypothetical protein [Clostridia bacterium]
MRGKIIAIISTVFIITAACFINAHAELNENEQGLLTAIGIIDSESDMSKPMTRGDMAELLSRFFSYFKSESNCGFLDVSDDNTSVAAVSDAGLMNGYDEYTFGINDYALTEQFIKSIVNLLGYEDVALQYGGYPEGYKIIAGALGITAELKSGSEITLGQAAEIIYSALNTNVKKRYYENDEAEETLLKYHFGIDYTKGRVTADSRIDLAVGSNSAAEHRICVDNVFYYTEENLDSFLGLRVGCYYTEKNGEREIVFVYPLKYNELEIDAEDITYAGFRKLTYETDARSKTVSIAATADFIKNDSIIKPLHESELVPEYGSVRLIDADMDGIYEIIFIDSVIVRQVFSVNAEEEIISVTRNLPDIDLSNKKVTIRRDGILIGIEDIQSDDILCIRADIECTADNFLTVSSEAEYIDITAVSDVVSGTVTAVNYGGDDRIDVNNQSYKLSNYFKSLISAGKLMKPRVGNNIQISLDENGNIAEAKLEKDEEGYAYLLNIYLNDDDETASVKILNFYNEEVVHKIADKLMLDGCPGRKAADLKIALTENGDVKAQVIHFTLNSSGEINKIDTLNFNPLYETKENSLVKTVSKQSYKYYYRSAGRNIGGKMIVDENATVFLAPLDENSHDAYDYGVYGSSYFRNNEYYYVDGYSFDGAQACKLFVVYYDKNQIVDTVEAAVVADIRDASNYDDDIVKLIDVYESTGYASYETAGSNVEFINSTDSEGLTIDDVSEGDVIRYSKDRFGAISVLELCCDADGSNTVKTNGTFTSTYRTTFGYIYDVGENIVRVVYDTSDDLSTAELISVDSCVLLKYDKKSKPKLKKINTSEMVSYLSCHDYDKASKVFTYANKGYTKIMVVY